MDIGLLIFGIVFFALGGVSAFAYITKNNKLFWKRERMIAFWGKKAGTIIHFIGYVIVPMVFGLYLIFKSIK